MEHHFNVEIAQKHGLVEAILLNNLWFWVKKNEANGMHLHDGEYWTYNSIKAFEKLFPYLSNKQIRTTLKHLIDAELIKTGSFNKSAYDRTTWYTFTEKGLDLMETSSCPVGQMELPTRENGSVQKGEPIPYKKLHIETTDKKTNKYADEFEVLWKMYPKKQGKDKAMKSYEKARKSGTAYKDVFIGLEAYLNFIEANQTDMQYVKMGSTFFSQKAWQDDWTVTRKSANPFMDMLMEGGIDD